MRVKQENGRHGYGQGHLGLQRVVGPGSPSTEDEVAQDLSMSQEDPHPPSYASEL